MPPMDTHPYLSATRNWIESVVIGLQLCPFAAAPFRKDQIRYVVSHAVTEQDLLQDLQAELQYLFQAERKKVETSLLIHPFCLPEFEDYWDFLALAEDLVVEENLEGEIQLAGFHPKFRFAETETDDAENYTNRSPFPMIHLLREESVTQATDNYPDTDAIPERNVELLRKIGLKEIQALRARCMK